MPAARDALERMGAKITGDARRRVARPRTRFRRPAPPAPGAGFTCRRRALSTACSRLCRMPLRGALLCRSRALFAAQRSSGSVDSARAGLGSSQPGVVAATLGLGQPSPARSPRLAGKGVVLRRQASGPRRPQSRTPLHAARSAAARRTLCGLLFARSTPTIASSKEPLSSIWKAQRRPIRGNSCFRSSKPTPRTARALLTAAPLENLLATTVRVNRTLNLQPLELEARQ